MKIKILKGSDEIGGSCLKISTDKTTLLVDYGTPLKDKSFAPKIDDKKIDAILISHPHQDHYGEIVNINKNIPIYCGELTLDLMNSTRILTGNNLMQNKFFHFKPWKKFNIREFEITPYLVDHSATDSYAFLIENGNKKILYSGDFRANGRKSKLFYKMINDEKLKNLDALIMEGTMIKRDNGEFKNENDVENRIYETIKNSNLITFMISSSQNIDSLVSAFRACLKRDKIFVIDIYTAWVLEKVKNFSSKIMNLNFENVKIYKPTCKTGGYQYGKIKEYEEFFKGFKYKIFHNNNIITFEEIKKSPSKYFIKCSPWFIENILKEIEEEKANIIYSQWLGYLKKEYSDEKREKLFKNLRKKYNWVYAHTSGHADLKTLQKFANSLKPKKLIPIHTEYKNEFKKYFNNVFILNDNEEIKI